jgi:hypothetical protein
LSMLLVRASGWQNVSGTLPSTCTFESRSASWALHWPPVRAKTS